MIETTEVSDILARAAEAVENANVPAEFRLSAFERAVDLLSSGRSGAGSVSVERALVPVGSAPPTTPLVMASSAVADLAARMRVTPDVVERVYTESGDGLVITVDPDRLAKSRSAGARELALLVTAAKQSAADAPTGSDDIRRAAEEYDKFDGPNFAATLATMKGTFLIAGPARARTYKLTKPGWVAAAALVARLGDTDRAAA